MVFFIKYLPKVKIYKDIHGGSWTQLGESKIKHLGG